MLVLEINRISWGFFMNSVGRFHPPNLAICFSDNRRVPSGSLNSTVNSSFLCNVYSRTYMKRLGYANFSFRSVSSIHGRKMLLLTLELYLSTWSSADDKRCASKSPVLLLLCGLSHVAVLPLTQEDDSTETADRVDDVDDARCLPSAGLVFSLRTPKFNKINGSFSDLLLSSHT